MSQRHSARSEASSEIPPRESEPRQLDTQPPYPWARAGALIVALTLLAALAISQTGIGDSQEGPWSWLSALGDDLFFPGALLGAFILAASHLRKGRKGTGVRHEWLAIFVFLGSFALLPFFALLTTAFRPLVLDHHALLIDGSLGFQPIAKMGNLLADSDGLKLALSLFLALTPVALAIGHVVQARSESDRGRLLLTIAALTFVCAFCHHLVPVAGPLHAFPRFPELPVDVERVATMLDPLPRNGLPALPMAYALALYWQSRELGARARAFGLVWLSLTAFASLALGLHYLVDLVVAIPMTAAVVALCARRIEALDAFRFQIVVVNLALFAGWIAVLHARVGIFDISPLLPFFAMLSTLAIPWELQRRWTAKAKLSLGEVKVAEASLAESKGDFRLAFAMGAMFFVSGAAGLVYEVVFAKSLALTFGSTTRASTTVLATYMGGMAAGAWLGGRISGGKYRPLVIYAVCEAGVAIWCALSPFVLSFVQRLYIGLATGADPSSPWLGALQVLLGALVLLPPTILMGVTLPVVAKQFEKRMALGRAIGLLYGANTIGAGLASLSTGYFLLPLLGITRTTWLAVFANFGAALLALQIDKRTKLEKVENEPTKSIFAPTASLETSRFEPLAAATVLTVGGIVTLALEVVYIHLLAIVAGNSAYAFSLMLFAFLLGLGGGAAIGRKLLEKRAHALRYLAFMQFGLAACVLLGVFGWEAIPDYFASFADYPFTRGFGARELVRAAICCMAMIPPAIFIGAAYPLAMACRVEGATDPIRATGRASALNTVGNVTGAFLGSFVLVPYLGALLSLQLLAGVACTLGILGALACTKRRERFYALAPGLAVIALFFAQPSAFNLNRLASGTNVYFEAQGYGKVVDHAESADGGLTMVTALHDRSGHRVLTLLTNGKFQGDDSQSREMAAQHGFALFPLLHTAGRERALVIGFGTGVSARAVDDAGFLHTDIVDLSADIFRLADKHFQSVNGAVLHRPRVDSHVTDGRNFLLLTEDEYDLIGLEISSIWFAGAASLYNREFYDLVKSRLREGGVLQQWVQLHRLSPRDLGSIFASLQAEFEKVWLYFGAGQGVLVACDHDCEPNAETLARINQTQTLRFALSSYGGTAERLMQSKLLGPSEISAFVESLGIPREELVSTDDNLFLEYSTPRGNVRPYGSIRENVRMLSRFQAR